MCKTTPSASPVPAEKGFDRLLKVSKKRKEWATLPQDEKLAILEQIETIMTKELTYEDYKESGIKGAEMMGFDVTTEEGNYEAEGQTLVWLMMVLKIVKDLAFTYKVLSGKEEPPKKLTKGNMKTRKAINGQVVLESFPSFPTDEAPFSFLSGTVGEVWLDPEKIKDESEVETFNKEKAWDEAAGDEGGLMLVLGAGNQVALTAVDILQGLFMRNCVVYMKQHPLRDYANEILSKIFAPLIEKGYLDLELHANNERSAALVYHSDITAVHLTGGKKTHDLLVFGADPKEQAKNKMKMTPKLKATMTSELGAVSPWVVVPTKYTKEEMEVQAKYIAFTIHNNASCNCNSPKMLTVAEDWDQKVEFLKIVEDALANHPLPAAYYPGIEQRWQGFVDQYPDAKKIDTATGLGIEKRKLSPAKFADKARVLPYLQIQIDVDLDSHAGRMAVENEYAVNTEPFAPMYSIATLKGTSQDDLNKFSKTAATFCNDYLFGTLSGSMTCPPALIETDAVQTLIADLKYGSLGINTWGGMGYLGQSTGMWGAYPGETLDAVQSGIGKIGNMMGVPYFEKFVFFGPITSPSHGALKSDFKKEQRILESVNHFCIDGSVSNLIKLLSAVAGINLMNVALVGTSILAAGVAFLAMRRQ
ncbi:MAG: hypothetical protein SGILL_003945 [Bacillariaceae sp.]